jgi:hypothetical protein
MDTLYNAGLDWSLDLYYDKQARGNYDSVTRDPTIQ